MPLCRAACVCSHFHYLGRVSTLISLSSHDRLRECQECPKSVNSVLMYKYGGVDS